MTVKEKAKENYTKVYLQGDMSLDTEEKYFAYTKGYCKGHTDGLADGRKELVIKEGIIKYWKKLCKDKSNDVIELQKENAKLKERLKSEANEIIKDLLYCTDGIVEVSIPEENRFLSVKKLKKKKKKFLKECKE